MQNDTLSIYAVCDSCITSGITLLILFAKLFVISLTSQFVNVIGLRLFRNSVLEIQEGSNEGMQIIIFGEFFRSKHFFNNFGPFSIRGLN